MATTPPGHFNLADYGGRLPARSRSALFNEDRSELKRLLGWDDANESQPGDVISVGAALRQTHGQPWPYLVVKVKRGSLHHVARALPARINGGFIVRIEEVETPTLALGSIARWGRRLLGGPALRPGHPIGVRRGVAGFGDHRCATLSALVRDPIGTYGLSCRHLLGDLQNQVPNNLPIVRHRWSNEGLFESIPVGSPVRHSERNALGTVDSALISLPTTGCRAEPMQIGRLSKAIVPESLLVGQSVKKFGCVTRLTQGKVTGLFDTKVADQGTHRERTLYRVYEVVSSNKGSWSPFCWSGDSGALAVSDVRRRPQAVGMVIAQHRLSGDGVLVPIERILHELRVELIDKV